MPQSGLWPLAAYSLTGEIGRVLAESQRKSVLQREQKIHAEKYRGGRAHTEESLSGALKDGENLNEQMLKRVREEKWGLTKTCRTGNQSNKTHNIFKD